MKSNVFKLISSILMVMLLFNFIFCNSSFVYASSSTPTDVLDVGKVDLGGMVLNGLVGILTTKWRVLFLLIGTVFHSVGIVLGTSAGLTGGAAFSDVIISPEQIFFNKLNITSIDFFDFSAGTGVMKEIRTQVAIWYYVFRNLAIIILLCILLYIGIRMALSTIASEKAIYKNMLKDWVVSFALVFLLHYIIMFVLEINGSLVNLLSNGLDSNANASLQNNLPKILIRAVNPLSATDSWGCAILYVMMVIMTFAFLFTYIKRVFTVGFLVIISPLITITYSVDKLADKKSQALDTWLKEFVYNVLLQPFHCVIYMVFVSTALNLIYETSSIAGMVLSLMALKFVWDGEKIVRKIFGFDKATTIGDAMKSAAGTLMAVRTLEKVGGKLGTGGNGNTGNSGGSGGGTGGGNGGGNTTPNLQAARQAATPTLAGRAAAAATAAAANTRVAIKSRNVMNRAASSLGSARQALSNATVGRMAASSSAPVRALAAAMSAGGRSISRSVGGAIRGARTGVGNFARAINGSGATKAAWTMFGAVAAYAANDSMLAGASAGYTVGEVAQKRSENRAATRLRNREQRIFARDFEDIGGNAWGHDMTTQAGRATAAAGIRGIYANKAANIANYNAEFASSVANEEINVRSANPTWSNAQVTAEAQQRVTNQFEALSRMNAASVPPADAAKYSAIKVKQMIDAIDRNIAVESALGNSDAQNYVLNNLIDDVVNGNVQP